MTIRREPSEGQYACKGISANQAMRLKEHRDRARDEIVVGFRNKAAMAARPNMLAALAETNSTIDRFGLLLSG